MKAIRITFMLLAFTLFTACNEDDLPKIETAKVTYEKTNLSADFFKAGSSLAPTINWGGEQGSFSLGTSLEGVCINTTTGVLSWTKELPIGEHTLQAVATNSAGQIAINLTLNNPFKGVFSGSLYAFGDVSIDFYPDGLLQVKPELDTSLTGSGTWSRNGETNFTLSGYEIALVGTLNLGTTAIYAGSHSLSNTHVGAFEFTLQ